MPPCALIQRTERLLQQANHMLHQMLSIQTLASLTRQLSTVHRLVEEYGLRLPIGGLAALQVQPELHAAEVTDAIRHLTDTAPRSVESQYISQMPQTSFGSMRYRAQQIAVQDAFHPPDAMSPACG